jgi:predicted RNA binding protein YcfA (HicA-like mRNA interferase family)
MNTHFPAVCAKDVVKVLEKIGFEFSRRAGGSHAIYRNPNTNQRTVVSMHSKTIIKRKTLKSILNSANLSMDEFRNLL